MSEAKSETTVGITEPSEVKPFDCDRHRVNDDQTVIGTRQLQTPAAPASSGT